MKPAPMPWDQGPSLRSVLLVVALFGIVAGLRAAAPVLTPLALAGFVAAVSFPALAWMRARGVRPLLAIVATVLLDASIVALFFWIVIETVAELRTELPLYIERAQALEAAARARLATWGVQLPPEYYESFVQPDRLLAMATGTARNLTSWLSVVFLMLLYLIFILVESVQFPEKMRHLFGPDSRPLRLVGRVLRQVERYLVLKTLISLVTGITIGAGAALLGVDFAPFWGLLAFALNYIPSIGSVIAAIPGICVAFLQLGAERGFAMAAIYLVVNVALGNVADPILVGRELRLAPIVVLVSLVFWGWTWGVAGAFLAVPLTITLRVALQSSERWRGLAALMGPLDPSAPPLTGEYPAIVPSGEPRVASVPPPAPPAPPAGAAS